MKKFFDYSKLRGRIVEYGMTQGKLSEEIGISETSLSYKLNNRKDFSQPEISDICDVLSIDRDNVGEFFFKPKVQKTKQVS